MELEAKHEREAEKRGKKDVDCKQREGSVESGGPSYSQQLEKECSSALPNAQVEDGERRDEVLDVKRKSRSSR